MRMHDIKITLFIVIQEVIKAHDQNLMCLYSNSMLIVCFFLDRMIVHYFGS